MKADEDKSTNRWGYAGYIGVFGGVIWGGIHLIMYALNFTGTVPGFLLEPLFTHSFIVSGYGLLLGLTAFVLFSVVAAFVYMSLLRKVKGPWPGIGYGVLWWLLFYMLIGQPAGMLAPLHKMGWNTICSDFCLFVLWGLFIGYSVAMEFTDERVREQSVAMARK